MVLLSLKHLLKELVRMVVLEYGHTTKGRWRSLMEPVSQVPEILYYYLGLETESNRNRFGLQCVVLLIKYLILTQCLGVNNLPGTLSTVNSVCRFLMYL
mgnify:CR=1 FL=1